MGPRFNKVPRDLKNWFVKSKGQERINSLLEGFVMSRFFFSYIFYCGLNHLDLIISFVITTTSLAENF